MAYEVPAGFSIGVRALLLVLGVASAGAVVFAGCAAEELNPNPRRDRKNGEDGAGAEEGPSCKEPHAGPSATRRLTRFEYENTVRDLLGDASAPAASFPAEEVFYGFDNHATDRGVSLELATEYMVAAEKIASRATITKIAPCKGDEATCAREFIATFGKRAYRRPLDASEIDSLLGTFEQGKTGSDYDSGIRWVLQRILQAPSFLYRVESRATGEGAAGAKMLPIDGWELATRLSYFLWGTMPDDVLFDAAEKNALSTKEQVAAQARRMLADPRRRSVSPRMWCSAVATSRRSSPHRTPS
ncbi:MAG: hypothetical protein K0S65_6677 [Labilithrix sp.]|nr:hypothetical protein [Labilithrix sp.]